MPKKSRSSSGQQGTKEDESGRAPSRLSKAATAAAEQGNEVAAFSPASGKHSSASGDILSKRIRTMRKRLQRAEASEKKKAAGDKISAQQETAVADIPILRAVIKELEDVAGLTESDVVDVSKDDDETHVQIVNDENLVLQQTLRLVYAVNDRLPRITAAYVSDYERSQLSEFYRLIFSQVAEDAKAVDEKLDQPLNAATNHLRNLAERSPQPVDGMTATTDSAEKTSYGDIAALIDGVFGAPASGAGLVASPIECQCVRMPKLSSIFIDTDTDPQDPEDDFNMKVDVPPGGFTFIASAAVVDESDDEDNDAAQQKGADGAITTAMPQPTHADESVDTDAAAPAKNVGGFAHPIKGSSLDVASMDRSEPTPASLAEGVTMVMPVPAEDSTRDAEVSAVPEGVFTPYGVSAQAAPAMPRWSPVSGLPATTASMPGGMYGGMPMPFPPHMAMQYGYAPPHMYGMQSISPVGGAVVVPPGMGGPGSEAKPSSVPPRDSSVSGVGEPQKQQQQQMGEEMWMSGNGSEAVSRLSTHTPTAAVPGFQNVSVTPPVIGSIAGIDPYQQAMAAAAAAAAGYGVSSPYMYPHIDASNLSTAATGGGSENNESINSVESASNRGAGSRPNSMYYPQVAAAPAVADGQRGFNQGMAGSEYHQMAVAPYLWAQQSEPHQFIKNVQAGVYPGYPYQGQGQGQGQGMVGGQQQQQPQPSQNNQQSYYQGQGYRRRGSGSNNGSNSSGHQHSQHQRERRGQNNNGNNNGGYQQQHRQQRWNNNHNNNNSSSGGQHGYNQHHRQNNSSREVSQHHSQDTGSNFGGSDGSGFYPRQQ